MPSDDLNWAGSAFDVRGTHYNRCIQYYEGVQPMAFATEKFRSMFFQVFKDYSENLCAPVVDSLKDRLKIIGFRSSTAEMKKEQQSTSMGLPFQTTRLEDAEGQRAWDIWTENRMDLKSLEVHEESLKTGDGYVIVWPGATGYPEIFSQMPEEIRVDYDSNNAKVVLRAAKRWRDREEKIWRLNLYFADRIEKYFVDSSLTDPPRVNAWRSYEGAIIENPYGRVPVFHFPNRREGRYGVSELRDVYPIQDGLNKAVVDMLLAMEFAAYKQRYIVGHEVEIDPDTGEPVDPNAKNYGADRMMAFPDPETKVGQFDATDLSQFLKVQDKFWQAASRVTGRPLHYFFITEGDFPSGEAIKSAEGRFIKDIGDQQTSKGNIWEDVVKFAMGIEGGVADDLVLTSLWQDATPRSDAELADTAVKKKAVGVPRSQILREMGYSEEDIPRLLEEADAEAMAKFLVTSEVGGPGRPSNASQQDRQAQRPTGDQTRARQGVTQ